tara:strand:+ start:1587 stop:1793 length:207 start_codon:yes stop_codon:yes gene_type:complete
MSEFTILATYKTNKKEDRTLAVRVGRSTEQTGCITVYVGDGEGSEITFTNAQLKQIGELILNLATNNN